MLQTASPPSGESKGSEEGDAEATTSSKDGNEPVGAPTAGLTAGAGAGSALAALVEQGGIDGAAVEGEAMGIDLFNQLNSGALPSSPD